jgi:hypothetical protein
LGGQPNHFACEGTSHLLGTSFIGQMHEYKTTTGPFDKRRDGGFSSFANDQIALPMPWDSPVDRRRARPVRKQVVSSFRKASLAWMNSDC